MQPFHKLNARWLPQISFTVLMYVVLTMYNSRVLLLSAAPLFLFIMVYGLHTALRGTGVSFRAFFHRPANAVTLIRSTFVITGILCGLVWLRSGESALRWCAAGLITIGYAADILDGMLAQREKHSSAAGRWGAWYDRESDAALLLLSSLAVLQFEGVPRYFILPGLCRYAAALIFQFFPLNWKVPPRFGSFSKNCAALFQAAMVLLWVSLLFRNEFQGASRAAVVQIRFVYPIVAVLIFLSFLIEGCYRLKGFLALIPEGYRLGLYRSFLIYYHIPFRYWRMIRLYRRFIGSGELAFDVGAHLGNRTRVLADLGVDTVSFEPQPACRGLLDNWYGDDERIKLEFTALGAEAGQTEILLSSRHPTLASTDNAWVREVGQTREFQGIEWDARHTVTVHTLDEMAVRYGMPKFIKIDAEGHELSILNGLSAPVKAVSFELLGSQRHRAAACIDRLAAQGTYRFNYSPGETMWLVLNSFINADGMKAIVNSYPRLPSLRFTARFWPFSSFAYTALYTAHRPYSTALSLGRRILCLSQRIRRRQDALYQKKISKAYHSSERVMTDVTSPVNHGTPGSNIRQFQGNYPYQESPRKLKARQTPGRQRSADIYAVLQRD